MTQHILENAFYRLRLNAALGGSILTLEARHQGGWHHLLRPTATPAMHAVDTANFPMVPFAGRIRDGRFDTRDIAVQLSQNFSESAHPIHGSGWQHAWQIVASSDNHMILDFSHPAGEWPWTFVARQSFGLRDDALVHQLSVTNEDIKDMPAGLGFHPWFPDQGTAILRTNIGTMWQTDETVMPTQRVPLPAHWTLDTGMPVKDLACDTFFEEWQGKAVLTWPKTGLGLEITAPDTPYLVIYTPPDQDVFCIEPTSHGPIAFNDFSLSDQVTGRQMLSPGKSLEINMTYRAFMMDDQ